MPRGVYKRKKTVQIPLDAVPGKAPTKKGVVPPKPEFNFRLLGKLVVAIAREMSK